MDGELPKWERIAAGERDWDSILGGFDSCCDFPTSRFYLELADYYPDAKVVLSVRSAEGWVRSMRETLWPIWFGDNVMHYANSARVLVDENWRRYLQLMYGINWAEGASMEGGATADDAELGAIMERWNDGVKASIPAERLLVWDPADGWGPLCEFLEVPTPEGELPRINDTLAFKEGILGGAMAALNAWWDQRERPSGGLHGAALAE
jgi:hypothetical protein